jgi:hypothetical protein
LGKSEYFISTIVGRNWFVNFGMRLVALKTIGGCSHVRVLQHLEKVSRAICIGIPLMCESLLSVCKEFLGQLPKPLYYSHLHIVIDVYVQLLRAFLVGPKM